jgi:hypothetical protein
MNSLLRYREVRNFAFPWPPLAYFGFMLGEIVCCYMFLRRT